MDIDVLTALLYETESETLDFKSGQYRFPSGNEQERSELLKDILAFANTWKRSDAYILIGVDENRGGKAAVLGVPDHLRDGDVQQFVNSRTNRPVSFLVETVTIEGREIDVIGVSKNQQRPIFTKSACGSVKAGTVYVRRGSTTAEADPDEVAHMARAQAEINLALPVIEFEFANRKSQKRLGREVELTSNLLVDAPPSPASKPAQQQGLPPKAPALYSLQPLSIVDVLGPSTKDVRDYRERSAILNSIGFWIHNSGSVRRETSGSR